MYSIIETKERITEANEKHAQQIRQKLNQNRVFLVNLMSSPGAGKTTTLVNTIHELSKDFRIGVIEADVDSSVDAETISDAGAKVIQLHTGGACHMNADMTERGLDALGLGNVDLVFLENIGNLVCPAEFDVGADKKVMILSVPEGDDKPLKYPLMFSVSDALLVNKIDTKPIFDFDQDRLDQNIKDLNSDMAIFPLSAKTGEGFEAWIVWLRQQIEEWRQSL